MTATIERTGLWQIRPGWAIAVDLTPVEIVNTRKVRSLKKVIVAGLALVVLLCVGATFMALLAQADAQESYDAAQANTADLQARAAKYADITAMKTTIAQVEAQVSTLMANDVDFVNLMARIRIALPPGVTIDNEAVALAQQAPADAAAAPATPGTTVIGTVTLSGSGGAIKDLAPFVTTLIGLEGVVDVVPTSTSKTETGMEYTLTLNITDAIYTHRFDPVVAQ
jgi:hypothetical protein